MTIENNYVLKHITHLEQVFLSVCEYLYNYIEDESTENTYYLIGSYSYRTVRLCRIGYTGPSIIK